MQKAALLDLLKELADFDLCLYTGHELEEVPQEIMRFLRFIKIGRFIQESKTTIKPFVGSYNQELLEVKSIE